MSNTRKNMVGPFVAAGVIAAGAGATTSLFAGWQYLAAGAIAAVALAVAGAVLETGRR